VSEREQRIVENEALFRTVNERIEDLNASFAVTTDDDSSWVCECGDSSCVERIEFTVEEYERVRENSHWFLIKPGHEIRDVEHVIERHENYLIVEKPDATFRGAHELDERTDD
jgi:hypothetical protein